MKKLLVVDNPLISVWVYPERGIVHHCMKRYCHGEDFRAALLKEADAMKLHKATKLLSDDRANGAVVKADQEWAQTVWRARMLDAGWKHWGIVQPEQVIGQLMMKRAVAFSNSLGITTRMFSDPDEAMKWLDGL